MLAALAFSTASRSRGLALRSPPPWRAATMISRMTRVQTLPRFSSWRPLRCWMFAHLLCPAMAFYLAVLCFQSKLRVYCPAHTTPAGGPGIRAGAFGDNLSMTPSPTVGTGNPDTLAPHAPLPLYYNNEVEHQAFLRRIFDSTAADYDRIEAVLAFGTGPSYRRAALQQAGLAAGAQVLDVGIGTGLVAREALKIIGPTASSPASIPAPA
jgi:hypothetical protein